MLVVISGLSFYGANPCNPISFAYNKNPILADVFGRMRLMERRGSGFKKILDAYEAQERYKEELKPVFYTDGYNFFLTLWNLNYAYDKAQNKAQKSQMTDREHILLLLKENPSLSEYNCCNLHLGIRNFIPR